MSHPRADLSEEVTDFVSSVIVAGGSGLRFGTRKQFALLAGRSVLEHTLETVLAVSDQTVIVVPEDSVADTQDCLLYTSPSPRDATLSRMPSSA